MYSVSDYQFQEPRRINSAPILLREPNRSLHGNLTKSKGMPQQQIDFSLRSKSRGERGSLARRPSKQRLASVYGIKQVKLKTEPISLNGAFVPTSIDFISAELTLMQINNDNEIIIKPTSAGINISTSTSSTSAAINLYEAVALAGLSRKTKKLTLSGFDRPKSRKLYALDSVGQSAPDRGIDEQSISILQVDPAPTPLGSPTSEVKMTEVVRMTTGRTAPIITSLEAVASADIRRSSASLCVNSLGGVIKRRTPRSLSGSDTQANGRPPSRQNSAFSFHLADNEPDMMNAPPPKAVTVASMGVAGVSAVDDDIENPLQRMNRYFLTLHSADTKTDDKIRPTDLNNNYPSIPISLNHINSDEDLPLSSGRPPSRQKVGAQNLNELSRVTPTLTVLPRSTTVPGTSCGINTTLLKPRGHNNNDDEIIPYVSHRVVDDGVIGRQNLQHIRPTTATKTKSNLPVVPTTSAQHNYTRGTSSWAAARDSASTRRAVHTSPSRGHAFTNYGLNNNTATATHTRTVESRESNRFKVQPWFTTTNKHSIPTTTTTKSNDTNMMKNVSSTSAMSDLCDSSVLSDVSEDAPVSDILPTEQWSKVARLYGDHTGDTTVQEWFSDETENDENDENMPQRGVEASASVLTLDSNLDYDFLQLFST